MIFEKFDKLSIRNILRNLGSISTPSPLKLTVKLAKIPKSKILLKVGVKDEVSKKTSTGAMGVIFGMRSVQGWGYIPHIKL